MSKLTPLAFAALALLNERPMHPYEMFQTLVSRGEDRVVKVRPGSLYHAIARLAEDGLVLALGTEREGNRPERTSYRITEDGRTALREQLVAGVADVAEEFPEFPLMLSEAHNLEPEVLRSLLAARAHRLAGEIGVLDAARAGLRARELHEMLWIDLDYLRSRAAAELAWLEALAERIRSGELAWHPDQFTDRAPLGAATTGSPA